MSVVAASPDLSSTLPCVSVILPVYNHAAYVTAALDSVRAQTLQDWELIVELAAGYLSWVLPTTAQQSIVRFMERYGMRGIGEIDLGQPRWRERPEPLMQTLQSYLRIGEDQAPDILFARGEQRANAAIERLAQEACALPGGWLRARLVRAVARRARALGTLAVATGTPQLSVGETPNRGVR